MQVISFLVMIIFICAYKTSFSAAETILFLKTDIASEVIVTR